MTSDLLPRNLPSSAIDARVAAGVRDQHTIYKLDGDLLRSLEPDVVVTQSLCTVCAVPISVVEDVRCEMPKDATIVAADPATLAGVWGSFLTIGEHVGAGTEARRLVDSIHRRLARVASHVAGRPHPRVAVIEWSEPLFAPGHWVPEMVEAAGGISVLGDPGEPSRPAAPGELEAARPDVLVLALCGFGLHESQLRVQELSHYPGWQRVARRARLVVMDGSSYFSRPGPRLADGVELLAWALHRPHLSLQPPIGRAAELIEAGWVDLAALRAAERPAERS